MLPRRIKLGPVGIQMRDIQSEFSSLIATCFFCAAYENLSVHQGNILSSSVCLKTYRYSKKKFYSDHMTHLYNEKRPPSCTACCSRQRLVHYHRHTLLQSCSPLYRRHRNLVPASSGAVVMVAPPLLDLLQLGLCRCMACQAPSTCKETVGVSFSFFIHPSFFLVYYYSFCDCQP